MRTWSLLTVALLAACNGAYDRSCNADEECVVRAIDDACSTCVSAISAHEASRADRSIAIAQLNCDEVVECDSMSGRSGQDFRAICDSGTCSIGSRDWPLFLEE